MKTRNSSLGLVRSQRCRGAFTLVELLVVVAIVLLLVALSFPALRSFTVRAESSQCIANLKSLFVGLSQYAEDHQGYYPAPMGNTLPNGSTGSWTLALAHGNYLGPILVETNVKNPFLCPTAKRTFVDGLAKRTYSLNTLDFITNAININRMPYPAQTIILADGMQSSPFTERDCHFYFRSDSLNRVEERHEGKMNCLFLDGHIEARVKNDPLTKEYLDNLKK